MAVTLFGASIVLTEAADGYRLRQDLYDHYVGLSLGNWFYELTQILQFKNVEGVKGDIYSHVFSYIIGHIMGIPSQYFVFVSFVFGYFYVNSLAAVLRWDRRQSRSLLFWGLVLVFITYRFVDTIQSVRTWTGAWVLFYGVYRYHLTQKIKYIWLIACAPLFHVAYFVIALPAFGIVFVKWFTPKILIVLYIFSFVITLNPAAIIGRLESTEVGASKVEGYYLEDPSEGDKDRIAAHESAIFYYKYGKSWGLPNGPHLVAVVLILFGLFSRKRMNELELGVFSTGILMAVMGNLGDFVSVFYNRTMANAGIYILATLIMLLIREELLNVKGWTLFFRKVTLWIVLLAFFPYLLYVLSNITNFTNIFMIVGAPVGFFTEFNISIRQLIDILLLK